MIKRIKNIAIVLPVLAVMLSGCWFVRMGMRNLDDAVFSSPIEVKNKIKNPIQDNVRFSALWVGHSTILLQIDDKVIITDPVFEDVIGGVMMRKVEAGLDIESIPKLDLILISHAHMDHLSFSSLKKLDEKFHKVKLVFPEGTEKYLPSYNMEMIKMRTGNSKERHYIGETKIVNGITVTTVYALHQGGRFGFDSYFWNVPGCTGYIIEYNGITVYFAGDTTYDDEAFKAIGKEFKIDLALIPVGPCRECETDGNYFHVASLGSLKMLDDLRADYMIPIHWGSLTYFNDPDTPIYTLKDLIEKYSSTTATGVASNAPYSEKVKILSAGEQIIFKYK